MVLKTFKGIIMKIWKLFQEEFKKFQEKKVKLKKKKSFVDK
jgi:hypothetical protein